MVTFVACNQQNKAQDINKTGTEVAQKVITFADFKKVKGVDNVQDVPFQLFTKLDSVQFFVSPNKDAAHLKMAYNKLDNYYGFEEFDDFYSIHYSINNAVSNSIEAFVLKSEFTGAFDLTLKGLDLYQIRSSTLKGTQDFKNKSFSPFGTISEVSEQEFKAASPNKIDEVFVKNPQIRLKNNNWIYTENSKETVIIQHKNVATEDGLLTNEYLGQSPYLHMEIFREDPADTSGAYYSFYAIKPTADFALFTGGYPHILPNKKWITYIGSNNDVGSNFEISTYSEQSHTQESLFYANFTNFKIGDETKAFWKDDKTFYAEVYPTNSSAAKGKKQKPAFIKIQLKPDLL